ncbi:DUF4153 domain-containing protein [Methylosinus sp. Sm6]|uniref:DUF4153 domain-containing protein n=1 Tax=Methylosinus sp. Sm6 TaxID=2866948 RepID=UPI001C990C6C|nr:DUF4153 domain-containing protein [Methylosinus sp. Sm6]MBY6242039.1 DUF4153 domain-containing protein [Methylosinus sp. Sm6]
MKPFFLRRFFSRDERRFRPLLADALAVACAALQLVESPSSERREIIVEALIAAWLASLAAGLLATALRRNAAQDYALQSFAALAAGAAIWFSEPLALFHPAFFAALAFACLAAPLPALKDAEAYWAFVEKFCFAARVAGLGAAVGWVSVWATIWSAELLFHLYDAQSSWKTSQRAAIFLFFGVAPIVFAARLPAVEEIGLAAGARDLTRRGVAAVTNWALAPFVLVYSALLWAYAGKIALAGSLPMGEVGRMVGAFGFSALATIAFVFPDRASGPRHVRLLWRIWPYLLPAPLILLTVAIWERVDAYGFTPDRYIAVLLTALCAANGVVALGRRERIIRFAPAAAAIGSLLASLGPWGAIAVSTRWQAASMRSILVAHGASTDNRLADNDERIALSEAETKKWQAARDVLERHHGWSALFPGAPEDARTIERALQARVMVKDSLQSARRTKFFTASSESSWLASDDALRTAHVVARIVVPGARTETLRGPGADNASASLTYEANGSRLIVEAPGHVRSTFDLADLMWRLAENKSRLAMPQIVTTSDGAGDLALLVDALAIRVDDGVSAPTRYSGFVLATK